MKILRSLSFVALVLCASFPAAADVTRGRDVVLVEGRGELLEFGRDIQRVLVSEPKIADAVVVSLHEVMIDAKAPGLATVMVWETGAAPTRFEVTVTHDNTDWDSFSKKFQESADGEPVHMSGNGETIVLTGAVKTAEDSKRLASLAQTHAKTVINLLKAPPPPEPRSILLQVKIADVNRVALTQIGFNLFSTNPKFPGETSTQQFSPPLFSPLTTTGGTSSSSSVNFSNLLNLFAFRPDLGIGATIEALQERNLLQILAEPNLICLEGKDASFLAGGSFPFPTIVTTPTGGATAPVVTVQFKPFGVKLDFTPTVTASGSIDLKVAPEVSSLDYTDAVTVDGYTIPALAQRRAETEVILKDGESFAIAGLINNQIVETIEKVPGLGNIPILGKLFQSRSTSKSDDELLVLITARFVRPLSPEQKAKLPDMPEGFLPTVVEEQAKHPKKGQKPAPPDANAKPELVGPSGQVIPKQ
ncbi:MAG: type II and III secretion system protein family protein [Bryobacteraceae bacterium]